MTEPNQQLDLVRFHIWASCHETNAVTSLFEQPDSERFIRKAIRVDRYHLYGLDPGNYVGMVHYDDVPQDREPSDLTARFHIKKVDWAAITLEFLDIHVM